MRTRGRPSPRPRARPHPFTRDHTAAPDHRGRPICRCGSVDGASVHRYTPRPRPDVARLAAGDHDEQ